MTSEMRETQNGISAARITAFVAFALLMLCVPGAASAQWTAPDAQGNISTTNTGNVGIGTSTPGRKLEVLAPDGEAARLYRNGNGLNWGVNIRFALNNSNNLLIDYAGLHGQIANPAAGAEGGNLLFTTATAGQLTEKMRLDSSGNLGIGTTSPAQKLDVRGDVLLEVGGNPTLYTGTGAGELGRYLHLINSPGYTSASGLKVGGVLISDTYAYANPAKNDLIVKGNIGIGTAAPSYKLDVAGPVRSSAGGFVFPDGTTQTTASAAPTAASISAGQFGQSTGGGNFSFPSNVLMNSTSAAFIDTGMNNRFRVCGPSGSCLIAGEYIGGRLRLSGDGSFANAEAQFDPGMGGINAPGNAFVGGNVGIGTTAPTSKLHVVGDITVTGNINAKYQDVAEWVPSAQKLSAGTVVVLDARQANHVSASAKAYDTRVAGVVSAQPGIALGERGEGKALVATTGRVKVKVDASKAPIQIGDLLVTGDAEGVAMKSEPITIGGRQIHAPGTIIGKALEPLAGGTGEILVLLSLQ